MAWQTLTKHRQAYYSISELKLPPFICKLARRSSVTNLNQFSLIPTSSYILLHNFLFFYLISPNSHGNMLRKEY